jgi:phosphate transport system substrate-binding protein
LFIYVKKASLKKPGIKEFVNFYLDKGEELSKAVGYIPFLKKDYEVLKKYFAKEKHGSPKNEKHAGEFFSIKDIYSVE